MEAQNRTGVSHMGHKDPAAWWDDAMPMGIPKSRSQSPWLQHAILVGGIPSPTPLKNDEFQLG